MPEKDRDKTGDVGSGQRRITRDDKGKGSQKKAEDVKSTNPDPDSDDKKD